jgi:hypothetical protein
MGQAKGKSLEEQRSNAELQNRTDHVATSKGFACDRCQDPLPRESWGIQKLCSRCQQASDNS